MAEFNGNGKYPTVHFRVKCWVHADGKVKIVGDDADLPGNGMFLTVRSDTDTEQNLKQMIDNLNPANANSLQADVGAFVSDLDTRQKQKLIEQLQASLKEDETIVTPYEAAKLLSAWGVVNKEGEPIREQMIYSYAEDGRIETVEKNRIKLGVLRAWVKEYQVRNGKRLA